MRINANTPEEYINQLPEERKLPFIKLREVIKENLPKGITEKIDYGMITYVINAEEHIMFMGIANQKQYIALYHMGIYVFPKVLNWFTESYHKYTSQKLNMGKGCIRFTNVKDIPYELIAMLCKQITIEEFLEVVRKYKKR